MYKILKNIIEMDDYSVQKLSNQPPEPFEWNTVEGTELNVSDCIGGKGKIEVKGNTEQEQLSGKNLWGGFSFTRTMSSVTHQQNADGSINVNGTTTGSKSYSMTSAEAVNNNRTITLPAGTYCLSGGVTNVKLQFVSTDGTAIFTTNSSGSFTLTEETEGFVRTYVLENTSVNNETLYVQLEEGSTATEWEPYCGGQAAPNPSYEIPIKVVTGDNVIKHVGKNEFYGEKFGLLWWNSTTGNFTNSGNFKSFICMVKPNTQYVISKKNVSNRFIVLTSQNEPAAGKPYKRALLTEVDSQRTSYSFTTQSDENYIFFGLYSGTDEIEIAKAIEEIQLEEGSIPTQYEPYKGESFEVNLGKNLFDKDNANIINAGISSKVISTSEYNRVLYIPVKASTTYTIQRRNDGDVNRFRVGSCTVIPANNVSVTNAIENDNATNITITTGVNDKYLAVMYYRTYETVLTEQQILDSIQIEEGSTATPYSKYFTPIELCKIGDYSDILFKNEVGDENYNAELESGAWYKKGVIGKQILNGTENCTTAINRNTYNKVAKQIQLQNAILNKGSISNLIVSQHFRSESADNIFDNNAIGINCAGISTAGYLRVGLELDKFPTDSSFKEWLAQNNDVVRFPVQTPTYEKITDTTLISQLEALRKAKWFKGVNHWWTETNNLESVLKGTYRQAINE